MSGDKYRASSAVQPIRTKADAAARASEAWRLRVSGYAWEDIAQRLGMRGGAPAAWHAVKNFFGTVPQPDRDLLRGVARARGEELWRRAFEEVERSKGGPAAVRAAIDVLRRQAALDGLDMPTRVEITPADDELNAWVAAVVRMNGASPPIEADPWADAIDIEVIAD